MPYPSPTERDVRFFAEHGWIAVEDAVDPEDLRTVESRCEVILEKKETWNVTPPLRNEQTTRRDSSGSRPS